MSDDNVWSDEWEPGDAWSGGGGHSKRLPRGDVLGGRSPECYSRSTSFPSSMFESGRRSISWNAGLKYP